MDEEIDFEEEIEVIEEEKDFLERCAECYADVDEIDAVVCAVCGAVYHEWCAPDICVKCGEPMEEDL
ncbi:MAG: hypothetical protein ACXQT5_03870 [Candidatus Syntropharchaeia archaeon]